MLSWLYSTQVITGLNASFLALNIDFLSEEVGAKFQRWLAKYRNGLKYCVLEYDGQPQKVSVTFERRLHCQGCLPPWPWLALLSAWPLKSSSVPSSARTGHPSPWVLFWWHLLDSSSWESLKSYWSISVVLFQPSSVLKCPRGYIVQTQASLSHFCFAFCQSDYTLEKFVTRSKLLIFIIYWRYWVDKNKHVS